MVTLRSYSRISGATSLDRLIAASGVAARVEVDPALVRPGEMPELTGDTTRLRQADLSLSVMNRTRFFNTDMRDVEAYGGVFSGSNFAGADLTNASFVGAYLDGSTMSGAKLSGTNLSGAQLARAIGLTQGQLNQACGDDATVLPSGLRIPAC